jgi:hypothetical protein
LMLFDWMSSLGSKLVTSPQRAIQPGRHCATGHSLCRTGPVPHRLASDTNQRDRSHPVMTTSRSATLLPGGIATTKNHGPNFFTKTRQERGGLERAGHPAPPSQPLRSVILSCSPRSV